MIGLEGVTCRYGAAAVVHDLTLTVATGEVVALVGGSGSGKTTALKAVNRLVAPTSGRVLLDGRDVRDGPVHLLRRRIGYVFQRVGLFPHRTVAENVAVPLVLEGGAPERIAERVAAVLAAVELEAGLGARYPHELSGGQQQRVGVARALVAGCRWMLLDEPFGALDPLTRDRLQQLFLRLRVSNRLTGIFVTHDLAEALAVADRIAVMRAGRLVQVGTPAELVRSPADADVERLLDTPRRHAQAFDALLGGGVG